jgi:hypothetical protein
VDTKIHPLSLSRGNPSYIFKFANSESVDDELAREIFVSKG